MWFNFIIWSPKMAWSHVDHYTACLGAINVEPPFQWLALTFFLSHNIFWFLKIETNHYYKTTQGTAAIYKLYMVFQGDMYKLFACEVDITAKPIFQIRKQRLKEVKKLHRQGYLSGRPGPPAKTHALDLCILPYAQS